MKLMPNLKMKEYIKTRIAEVTEQIELLTDPDWVAWGYMTRAALHKELGDIEAAIQDLSTAIEVPDIPLDKLEDALHERSWIKYCNKQYSAALMDVEQILLEPDMPKYRLLGARMLYREIIRGAREAGIDLVEIDGESRGTV
jgi:hypothetical protein